MAIVHHFKCGLCHKRVERPAMPMRCDGCGSFGSFGNVEAPALDAVAVAQPSYPTAPRVSAGLPGMRPALSMVARVPARAVPLSGVSSHDVPRRLVYPPIDYVLGGELVPGECIPGVADGTVTQISGERGAGKSTLIGQALGNVCLDGPILYVAAEESDWAVGARMRRIGIDLDSEPWKSNFLIIETDCVEDAWAEIRRLRPLAWVLDSEQTLSSVKIDAKKQSSAMIKYIAQGSFELAHGMKHGVGLLVCQENKDGDAAGPMVAEHAVDACLSLDRMEYGSLRVLSCVRKNRNGPDTRQAILEMTSRGLVYSEDATTPADTGPDAPPRLAESS